MFLKERCGKKSEKVDLFFPVLVWRAELETGEVRTLLGRKEGGAILMYYGTSRSRVRVMRACVNGVNLFLTSSILLQGFTVLSEKEMEDRCVSWSSGCEKGNLKQLEDKVTGLSKDEIILKKGLKEASADLKVEKGERGKSMLPPRPQRENTKIVDKFFTHKSTGVVVRSWRDVERVEGILREEPKAGKVKIEGRVKKMKEMVVKKVVEEKAQVKAKLAEGKAVVEGEGGGKAEEQ